MRVGIPRFVIAAPASGSGKSTIATGLMAALSRSCKVQGFKVGPDYIDPMYHTAATGRISRNLDTWMVPFDEVKESFAHTSRDADVAVIEGVMGLFDGYDARTESGGTAEVAKLLGAPVILVLDVAKMARSAGALALGYRLFDPALNVAGVICNRVGSDLHAQWVREAVEAVGLPVLGCIPRTDALAIPERHLGLYTAVERMTEVKAFLEDAAALVSQHIDLDRVWSIAFQAAPIEVVAAPAASFAAPHTRIGVARDEAFCFYYEDNLDLLRAAGAEIIFFSPLHDVGLPDGIAGLYFGGGYPELYAEALSRNDALRAAVHAAHQADMPIYAECGGLMFLTQSIIDLEGRHYPMMGLLPGHSRMQTRLTMGYRRVTARCDSLLCSREAQVRGHEFHYSDWIEVPADLPSAYDSAHYGGIDVHPEGFVSGNLLASYVHLHFRAEPSLARNFAAACVRWWGEFVVS